MQNPRSTDTRLYSRSALMTRHCLYCRKIFRELLWSTHLPRLASSRLFGCRNYREKKTYRQPKGQISDGSYRRILNWKNHDSGVGSGRLAAEVIPAGITCTAKIKVLPTTETYVSGYVSQSCHSEQSASGTR